MTYFVVAVFTLVYAGMALGRWPGLGIDRTGIALLGGILTYVAGAVAASEVAQAIDWPTLFLLFGLMILSAQFAACGFYDWCAARIAATPAPPAAILALTVAVAGGLSAVLANDVVVFAMTPMLCAGLAARGLDPRPFLIALAGAANAGSAATVIGNPQNIVIGQAGGLEFWPFLWLCGPPALAGLAAVYAVVRWRWAAALVPRAAPPVALPALDRQGLAKAVVATGAILVLFATPLPQVTGVLAVAGALLVSRRLSTTRMLGLVDWHLLVLFAGLFVVTHAFAATGIAQAGLAGLAAAGLPVDRLSVLAVLALAGSNTIGNVPAVVLLLGVMPQPSAAFLHALAVLSTLAGNLFIVGSLANIIVVERARQSGVALSFAEHARCGVPMTLISFVIAIAWFAGLGTLPL
ncbi:MAG: SLC13 family permease [Thalassobaculales bacterium]